MLTPGPGTGEAPTGICDPRGDSAVIASAAPVTVRERVRWSDVDAAGIVCHGMYLRFFELAESELFRAVGLPARTLCDTYGLWLVRRRIECDFLQPVLLEEEVEISVQVGAIGRSSLELRFLVIRPADQALTAEGRYVVVAVDRDTLQPLRIPDSIRRALDSYR